MLLFTRHNLEPARIIVALMQSIEGYEFQHKPLVESVKSRFNSLNDEDGTPCWVLTAGEGQYIHRTVLACSKHPGSHRIRGRFCVTIGNNYTVNIIRCNASRGI